MLIILKLKKNFFWGFNKKYPKKASILYTMYTVAPRCQIRQKALIVFRCEN